MVELGTFLQTFKKIISSKDGERDILIKVLKEKTGGHLSRKDITIKRNVAHINGNLYIKSEIQLHKTDILQALKKEGITTILDIQ